MLGTATWARHLGVIVPILLLVFCLSGCEDCPVCDQPAKPYKGWLYYGDIDNDYIYKIDTETDSVVDSVRVEPRETANLASMDVSQDGRYLAASYLGFGTRIYDAQTLSLITDLEYIPKPLFTCKENLLLGIKHTPEWDAAIYFYSLPDFGLILVDTVDVNFGFPRLVESQNLIYGASFLDPEGNDSSFIVAYDYQLKRLAFTWVFRDDRNNEWINVEDFDVDPLRNRVHFIGGYFPIGAYAYTFDLGTHVQLSKNYVPGQTSNLTLNPNLQEFYVADAGFPVGMSDVFGAVLIFDAETGASMGSVSTYGYAQPADFPLIVMSIVPTPDGRKLYAGGGRHLQFSGTIAVIDVESRRVTKLIWPQLGHYFIDMVLGPKR